MYGAVKFYLDTAPFCVMVDDNVTKLYTFTNSYISSDVREHSSWSSTHLLMDQKYGITNFRKTSFLIENITI